MFCRMMIALERDEAEALLALAQSEMRDPREQVRFIVRYDLIQRGLLKSSASQEPNSDPNAAVESTANS